MSLSVPPLPMPACRSIHDPLRSYTWWQVVWQLEEVSGQPLMCPKCMPMAALRIRVSRMCISMSTGMWPHTRAPAYLMDTRHAVDLPCIAKHRLHHHKMLLVVLNRDGVRAVESWQERLSPARAHSSSLRHQIKSS